MANEKTLAITDTIPFEQAPSFRTATERSEVSISDTRQGMRVLLVEPESPPTYWSYSSVMDIIGKKAAIAPLGLITLAAQLPESWKLELADLNTGELEQEKIEKADAVFIGGMHVQAESFHQQAKRARAAGKKVVGGGPYVTTSPGECMDLDHLVLGEVEGGIKEWSGAFEQGEAPKIARMPNIPKLDTVPVPRYDLLKPNDYFSMGLQLSRGCPHNCEFCSVTALNGRDPRLKSAGQFLAEADEIRKRGFKGSTFVVDDNFIGNRRAVENMLPEIAAWQKKHGYPLDLFTQADLRLAEYQTLMAKMVDAGFSGVFLGIETPSKKALKETGKHQNTRMDLDEAVDRIARSGLEPMAGFIMGFDSDTEEDLDELRAFINRNPIPTAMVGVLQAAPMTRLHRRMESEDRLMEDFKGDQFGTANFETVMDPETLRAKYEQVLGSIYKPKDYFRRCLQLLQVSPNLKRPSMLGQRPILALTAFKNSIIKQGLLSEYRIEYWKFLTRVATAMPRKFISGVVQAVKFSHMYDYTHQTVLPRLRQT